MKNKTLAIRRLEWDSTFFGISIGRIHSKNITSIDRERELYSLLRSQKSKYNLIYLINDTPYYLTEFDDDDIMLKMVDEKLTFSYNFDELNNYSQKLMNSSFPEISFLEKSTNCPKRLIDLAITSGQFSRFKDDNFPKKSFEKLYTTWIHKSITKEIADAVIVFTDPITTQISGLITIAINDKTGNVGLLSVSTENQGKGVGKKLFQVASLYCAEKKCKRLEVSTQIKNHDAVAFYQAMGLQLSKKETVYHIWFKPYHT